MFIFNHLQNRDDPKEICSWVFKNKRLFKRMKSISPFKPH